MFRGVGVSMHVQHLAQGRPSDWKKFQQINLPIGALSIITVTFLLPKYPPLGSSTDDDRTILQKWLQIDWIGSILSLVAVTCFIIPLQWGGVTKPWDDPPVIALFVLSGVLVVAFILWESYRGDVALLPARLFKNRTQVRILTGISTHRPLTIPSGLRALLFSSSWPLILTLYIISHSSTRRKDVLHRNLESIFSHTCSDWSPLISSPLSR